MPAYAPLTKQDLLQRIKEQDETHKQRKLDLLERVKSLDARKKYVKELKSWLERRKLTTTDLLAMYRELQPKRGPQPVKSKNALQPTKKSAGERLVDAMREARMVEIDTSGARDLVERLGYKKASYSHILTSAMNAGLLRRGDRDGNGWKYMVTAGSALSKGAKPVTIKGNGDPVFCKTIREARIAKGWSHEEMGEKVGVAHSSVANWEQGRYTPKEEARQKIVKLLGLPSDLGAAATAAAAARAVTHGKITNGQAPLP
jgi:DNA-binding XRE family transcriptional regulator